MSKPFKDRIKSFGYHTEFSTSGDRNLPMASRACFADILNRQEIHTIHYRIKLYRKFPPSYNNFCLMTKKSLDRHLKQARRLFKFTYSIEEVDDNLFVVEADLACPRIYHRYFVTWLRYAYECPFNLILMDAYKLKDTVLKQESVPNLFVLVSNCSMSVGFPCSYNSGHSIAYTGCEFLKESTLKRKFNEVERLNSLYLKTNVKYDKLLLKNEVACYLDYWTNAEEFDKRTEIYLNAWKKLKETKN